jgi:hypothetical protein
VVASIQTFGAFAASFHPHLHGLVTEGGFDRDGDFLPLPLLDTSAIEELFRRLLLARLHRAERLSEEFLEKLLAWSPSGFSLEATQLVMPDEPGRLERLARYLTRAPLRIDTVEQDREGRIRISTPPDPSTGATVRVLDPLDWIHAVTNQIPDRGQHGVRYYGHYANKVRGLRRLKAQSQTRDRPTDEAETTPYTRARKASWARLLRKLLEVDPLLCARCGGRMRVVAFITDPAVVDRILRHLASPRSKAVDPFQPRPPPPT